LTLEEEVMRGWLCAYVWAFGPEPGIDALTECYFYGNLSFGSLLECFSVRAHTQSVIQHSHSVTPTQLKLMLKLITGQKRCISKAKNQY